MKKLLLALVIPGALALTACTDEQVAAGAGFIGGVIVGGAIADGYYNDGYYGDGYYGGYNRGRHCSGYYDYYGRYVRQCRGVGYGYGWKSNEQTVSVRAQKFATKYGTSLDAGETVVQAFDGAAKGDMTKFNRIGLNKEEMMAIYDGKMPSSTAMSKLSKSLDLDRSQARKVMRKMIAKVQAEKEAQGY